MKAMIIDPKVTGRLAIREVERPQLADSEALVRVYASSINFSDIYHIDFAPAGWQLGWDVAGVIEQAAADGSGFAKGTRVFGLRGPHSGAWSEFASVPTKQMAEIPFSVSFAQAATLPMAGLTALYALEKGGFALNKKILITGATSSVGQFLTQLARQAGAYVVATIRKPERAAMIKASGANEVVIGEDISNTRPFGPYDLIIDILGGNSLAVAISTLLVPNGLCINLGIAQGNEVKLNLAEIFGNTGGVRIQELILFTEMINHSSGKDLASLVQMIADKRLNPPIEQEASWEDPKDLLIAFRQRKIAGKAILTISD